MNITKFLWLTIFCALLCLSAAAQKTAQVPNQDAPTLKQAVEKRYRLAPGDVLEVIYRYTPEFNQTVTIQPDGFIVLEIVGELKISELTVGEARQKILEKASVRLKDPEITLLLKEFQKPYFVVAGEVLQPGKFVMNESITALQAVLLAGGFRDSGKRSQVLVFRKINAEFAEVKMLNLKTVKKTSDLENDLELETGDIIFVPRNAFSKFERYVRLSSITAFLNPLR